MKAAGIQNQNKYAVHQKFIKAISHILLISKFRTCKHKVCHACMDVNTQPVRG